MVMHPFGMRRLGRRFEKEDAFSGRPSWLTRRAGTWQSWRGPVRAASRQAHGLAMSLPVIQGIAVRFMFPARRCSSLGVGRLRITVRTQPLTTWECEVCYKAGM